MAWPLVEERDGFILFAKGFACPTRFYSLVGRLKTNHSRSFPWENWASKSSSHKFSSLLPPPNSRWTRVSSFARSNYMSDNYLLAATMFDDHPHKDLPLRALRTEELAS